MTCAVCNRPRDGLDAWYTVVSHSLVGDDRWEETRRLEVCSWACLRLAYMAPESDEEDELERWKVEGN